MKGKGAIWQVDGEETQEECQWNQPEEDMPAREDMSMADQESL